MSARKKMKTAAANLVRINRGVSLALDLSSSGVREALVSLTSALEASEGSGMAQLRLDPRDLNAIYVYLSSRQLKMLVGRLKALSL